MPGQTQETVTASEHVGLLVGARAGDCKWLSQLRSTLVLLRETDAKRAMRERAGVSEWGRERQRKCV